jgi:mono/diheme cytochrome c family protein
MPNVLLFLLLAGLVGLHWLILPDPSRRNYEFLPDMVVSAAHDAQAPIPALPGGVGIDLRPPPGAVARGYLPLGYAATPEGARLAGGELHNPFPADDAGALARGAAVFNTFCSVCHGLGGLGDGSVTKRGVPPPPSLLADKARRMSDGQIYHVISMGQGNMASYASQVEREDRWKAILYVRSLQGSVEEP